MQQSVSVGLRPTSTRLKFGRSREVCLEKSGEVGGLVGEGSYYFSIYLVGEDGLFGLVLVLRMVSVPLYRSLLRYMTY